MDGGFSEKLPVMEKCGSLIFGRLQLKLNTFFSLFTMPDTVLQMVLNTFEMVLLIPFTILAVSYTHLNYTMKKVYSYFEKNGITFEQLSTRTKRSFWGG